MVDTIRMTTNPAGRSYYTTGIVINTKKKKRPANPSVQGHTKELI